MIEVGEVILVHDPFVNPPKRKFQVCVSVSECLYLRINTRGHWNDSLKIPVARNDFLEQDRHIECGSLLEIDDYEIEEALKERPGIIGRLSNEDLLAVLERCKASRYLSQRDKAQIDEGILSVL